MSTVLNDDQAKLNISGNLTHLLKARGWSQRRLAAETGETSMMISRICAGAVVANAATLSRIATILCTSVDWLLADHSADRRQSIKAG